MKKLALILIAISFTSLSFGQGISDKTSIGFQLNQYQKDFGMGLTVTSPYFLKKKMAVRLRGNLMFVEYVSGGNTTWSPYGNLMLGFASGNAKLNDIVRLYGEGGVAFLFPTNNFSTSNFEVGGYGLFGFEFHFQPVCYFIEIGGIGTGARADLGDTNPIYSNGIMLSAGFRFALP